jgi:hypothetical protein
VAGRAGAYRATVVFPSRGTWTYHVHDPIAGGGYEFAPLVVAAADESGDGLPSWVVVGAALGATLTAAAAIVARLRRRPAVA